MTAPPINNAQQRLERTATGLLLLLVLHYASWYAGANMLVMLGLVILTLLGLVALTALALTRTHLLLALLLAGLAVLMLGTPSTAWDPRSIWLMHAQRLYWDGSLFAPLDDYPSWSHNDYPLFVPAISATLAVLQGGWNEMFPRFANMVMAAPVLVLLWLALPPGGRRMHYGLAVLGLVAEWVVNGYMDGLLALYLVALFTLARQWLEQGARRPLTLLLLAVTLPLIKNEGSVWLLMLGLVMACAYYRAWRTRRWWGVLGLLALGLLPALLWRQAVAAHGLASDMGGEAAWVNFQMRVVDWANSRLIAGEMFGQWPVAAAVALFVVSLAVSREKSRYLPAGLLAAGMAVFLFLLYLSTPNELKWHLLTSTNRTMLPFCLLLAYEAIRLFSLSFAQKNTG